MTLRITSEIFSGLKLFLKSRQTFLNVTDKCSKYFTISRLRSAFINQSIIENPKLINKSYLEIACSSNYIGRRFKHKKPTKRDDSDDENENDSDDDNGTDPLHTGHVTSLRADAVLKAGLGMARNKVQTSFYESRIRVNGKKIPKKSYKIEVGDEVDVIKGENMVNNLLLDVSRVVLVSAKESDDGEKIIIKMKRYKNLTVEDYPDPWNK